MSRAQPEKTPPREGPALAPGPRTRAPRGSRRSGHERLDHHVEGVAALDVDRCARRSHPASSSRRSRLCSTAAAYVLGPGQRGHGIERARESGTSSVCRASSSPARAGSAISSLHESARRSTPRRAGAAPGSPCRRPGPARGPRQHRLELLLGQVAGDAAHPRRRPRPPGHRRPRRGAPRRPPRRRPPPRAAAAATRRRGSAGAPARPRHAAPRRAPRSLAASAAACSNSSWARAVAPRRAAMSAASTLAATRRRPRASVGLELGCLHAVVGDQLGELRIALAGAPADSLGRALVQPGALAARQRGVGDVADELVAEGERARRPRRGARGAATCGRAAASGLGRRLAQELGERLLEEARAQHRRVLHVRFSSAGSRSSRAAIAACTVSGTFAEPAVRFRRRRSGTPPPRRRTDCRPRPRRPAAPARGSASGRSAAASSVVASPASGRSSIWVTLRAARPKPGPALEQLRPAGAEHQDRRVLEPERGLLDEVEQAVVGPVGVVDPDHERALGGEQRHQPAPAVLERVLDVAVDRVAAERRAPGPRRARRRPSAPSSARRRRAPSWTSSTESSALGPGRGSQDLAERPEGDAAAVGRVAAHEDPVGGSGSARRLVEELGRQAGLADPASPAIVTSSGTRSRTARR